MLWKDHVVEGRRVWLHHIIRATVHHTRQALTMLYTTSKTVPFGRFIGVQGVPQKHPHTMTEVLPYNAIACALLDHHLLAIRYATCPSPTGFMSISTIKAVDLGCHPHQQGLELHAAGHSD